jgi:hypothetical protein
MSNSSRSAQNARIEHDKAFARVIVILVGPVADRIVPPAFFRHNQVAVLTGDNGHANRRQLAGRDALDGIPHGCRTSAAPVPVADDINRIGAFLREIRVRVLTLPNLHQERQILVDDAADQRT